ncbi:carboxypeptidase-like regulatory domain-containing protein [Planctomicrobium piriforme]|uniref:Carboxypeptidase regulatory-like domain-containing protein n=1 Tax=Planctomicrobium piriforme TaxID=1576369 RepID=A0A1I3HUS4_9PLAN|nr:carboxypeptidase-like regulatory domain-containing protein [Planctomicrobium piriforme]SFI39474.1 hypothetical protein SAMN05421753_108202 [Planctomicrobium piriforme]
MPGQLFKQQLLLLLALIGLLAGCGRSTGPELARVEGRVTLDGTPLPHAKLRFQPLGGKGTYSTGETDESGRFSLQFSRDRKGAMIGTHGVVITTGNPHHEMDDGTSYPLPEVLPAKYHQKSELTREVVAGKNKFEIELTSAQITAPPAKRTAQR